MEAVVLSKKETQTLRQRAGQPRPNHFRRPIAQSPASVETRSQVGHCEGDTVWVLAKNKRS